ncbi:hypothetical protein BDDG_13496, partial [Blastomyces dermatitidis ATCC 18188]
FTMKSFTDTIIIINKNRENQILDLHLHYLVLNEELSISFCLQIFIHDLTFELR